MWYYRRYLFLPASFNTVLTAILDTVFPRLLFFGQIAFKTLYVTFPLSPTLPTPAKVLLNDSFLFIFHRSEEGISQGE